MFLSNTTLNNVIILKYDAVECWSMFLSFDLFFADKFVYTIIVILLYYFTLNDRINENIFNDKHIKYVLSVYMINKYKF